MVTARDRNAVPKAAQEDAPRLAEGVELLGEYQGSGFKEPPSLIRKGDRQIVQLPPLLYQVVKAIDGHRQPDQIASIVSDQVHRGLTGEDIRFLVEEK